MKRRRHQHISKEDGLTMSQRNTLLKKKKKKNSTTTRRVNSDSIPIDLIIEILWRLPTKSIARFRCVSKLWASTLRLSCFTELFLTRSSSCPQLFFSYKRRDSSSLHLFSASQQVQNQSLVTATYHMKLPYNDSYNDAGSFDHLRGLTCHTNLRILNGRKNNEMVTVICNPSTRESLHLPMLKTRNNLVKSFLGYDPIGKQFKVLSMTWSHYKGHGIFEDRQVLTFRNKNNRWRKIECCVSHYASGRGICINGVLYYHAHVGNGISRNDDKIVWFDVRYEKFRVINSPDNTDLWLCQSTLVNYKDKLGVTFPGFDIVKRQITSFEFWVLVDAEKHEWSKHVYVLPSLWKNVVSGNDVLNIVGVIVGTNEIVLAPQYQYYDHIYVYYYDFEKETIRRVGIKGIDALTEASPYPRVETFLDHLEDVKLLKIF